MSEYEKLDSDIKHLETVMNIRFDNIDKETNLAMIRLNERLEEMNELRAQIASERGSYLTRERFDHEHVSLQQRVSALELQASRWSGSLWMLGGVLSGVVVVVNLLMRYWQK